jgi:hypothetical protein
MPSGVTHPSPWMAMERNRPSMTLAASQSTWRAAVEGWRGRGHQSVVEDGCDQCWVGSFLLAPKTPENQSVRLLPKEGKHGSLLTSTRMLSCPLSRAFNENSTAAFMICAVTSGEGRAAAAAAACDDELAALA